ncbi:MAG: phosphoenolpyruvate carboxykinase [Candidatus Omnitrophica bacterium]|nr:phosphoenolpyruvate carboxykinase [Candidatus Omnitrophota bacterium]MDE2008804.1 phosphoenolpyruvate carboxykinase [Candidatus Omnitrophota bacterium]MDE2213633.1 phosphoenolpyruvate carboxykinase [Candidatus Omnitrophota bacterium]MDE2230466.1 phosphoenolpyruvate carboxykinase [Candidatus Omnitrophota bacterium]
MNNSHFDIHGNKVIIHFNDKVCFTTEDVLNSELFKRVLGDCMAELKHKNSILLNIFHADKPADKDEIDLIIRSFKFLSKNSADLLPGAVPGSEVLLQDKFLLNDFIEYLYNYWRSLERFVVCDSAGRDLDQRPYRTFNNVVEPLSHLIRGTYRDIAENLTKQHPRIYRQVIAGAEVGVITSQRKLNLPSGVYEKLRGVPIIRQVLLYPPLILDTPMNKRTGKFERVAQNPMDLFDFDKDEWLCYPAKVGPLIVLVYFHKMFFELGLSLCNLFEMADDKDLERVPDAVFAFGVPGAVLDGLSKMPTVFFDDERNGLLVGAVPGRDEFGYFGYLKKMILTLHNIKIMKMGHLPFHGAMVRIILKGDKDVTVLLMGDTGAGKSETLEAFRTLGDLYIQDIIVIADDMGSLALSAQGKVMGRGTEIGAFLRLDDLQPGYALGQIDRAIIMNANQVNARIILPVTTFNNLIKGHQVDFILYANNYEDIDDDHPIIEKLKTSESAIKIFRDGTVMSKGTTTSSGIVHSYFANVFGPVQYKELHEQLAKKYFDAFFKAGVFVGLLRTRLGLSGWERNGPAEAAKEFLRVIQQ